MNQAVKKEVERIIKELNFNCLVEEFKDKVDWSWISKNQKLSEEFIQEFKDKVYWSWISKYQKLSEEFIEEFQNKVDWNWVSVYQQLSEEFIREFQDRVYWSCIPIYQNLSKEFIKEFKNKIDISIYKAVHQEKSLEQKKLEVQQYATKHNLKYDDEFLYAFRKHDKRGKGVYNKTISYKLKQYYRDWHCDMRKDVENSFGLGIWPKGNTPVKVKIEDWGCEVDKRGDGKARVWGFEICS